LVNDCEGVDEGVDLLVEAAAVALQQIHFLLDGLVLPHDDLVGLHQVLQLLLVGYLRPDLLPVTVSMYSTIS
jgi:hypothetical protein